MQTVTLPPVDAPRAARRVVQGCCAQAVSGPECTEHALLLTSEIVTNALVHGSGTVRVGCAADALTVRVEVTDDNRLRPSVRPAGEHDEGGRGMFLVDALASSWGVADTPTGKVVWFEVPAQP